MDKKMLGLFYELQKSKYARCLEPTESCEDAAIRAHSVQNSKILDLLAESGHVVQIQPLLRNDNPPAVQFSRVGRGEATTFTGLCKNHDHKIFAPIETQCIDPDNVEHLFLLSYRAVLKELHAQLQSASRIQTAYLKRIELGLDKPDVPSQAGMFATGAIAQSYECYCLKKEYDDAYIASDFAHISYDVSILDTNEPTIAACSYFSLDDIHTPEDTARASVNVLPLNKQQTLLVFGHLPRHTATVRGALQRVLSSVGDHQKYEVSKLLLNHCENFVLSPRYFNSWSEVKKDAVLSYFEKTLHFNDFTQDSINFYLF